MGDPPIQDKDKRSFEALAAIVYRPDGILVDQHHRQIACKSCALSATDDDLATMKMYLLHAALKQGWMTVVTAPSPMGRSIVGQ